MPTWRKWPGVAAERPKVRAKKLPVELPPAEVPSPEDDSPLPPENRAADPTRPLSVRTTDAALLPSRAPDPLEPPDPPELPAVLPKERPNDKLVTPFPAGNGVKTSPSTTVAATTKEPAVLLAGDRTQDQSTVGRHLATHALFVHRSEMQNQNADQGEKRNLTSPHPSEASASSIKPKAQLGTSKSYLPVCYTMPEQNVTKKKSSDHPRVKSPATSVKNGEPGSATSAPGALKQPAQEVRPISRETPATTGSYATTPSRFNQVRFR